ncbi:MAG TPA: nuclear transport factor 2 family protein [Pyrinomonadaceae bacterium]|nr:nuclear transport factor 2 family protein [Pyrinomonadaceae bacterium]
METDTRVCSNPCRNVFNRRLPAALRLLFVAGTIAAAVSGLTGCGLIDESQTAAPAPSAPQHTPTASPTRQTVRNKSAVRLPRLEAALVKTIGTRLNSWKATIEARDLEKHLQYYADQIETYYLASNVNRDFVRADRARAFGEFDKFKLEIINIDIYLESNEAATVTFDKGWNFEKEGRFSNGLVQQEIKMRKIDKQWLIVSERDLQVYRSHNQ